MTTSSDGRKRASKGSDAPFYKVGADDGPILPLPVLLSSFDLDVEGTVLDPPRFLWEERSLVGGSLTPPPVRNKIKTGSFAFVVVRDWWELGLRATRDVARHRGENYSV